MSSGLLSAVFPHGLQRWGLKTRQRPHRADGRNRNCIRKAWEDIWSVYPLRKGAGELAGRGFALRIAALYPKKRGRMGATERGQGAGQADKTTSGRRRGTPGTGKPFLDSARKWIGATFLCPPSTANSLAGWNRNILLCKIGSLVTFETQTIFILNSCELGHHLPPISPKGRKKMEALELE